MESLSSKYGIRHMQYTSLSHRRSYVDTLLVSLIEHQGWYPWRVRVRAGDVCTCIGCTSWGRGCMYNTVSIPGGFFPFPRPLTSASVLGGFLPFPRPMLEVAPGGLFLFPPPLQCWNCLYLFIVLCNCMSIPNTYYYLQAYKHPLSSLDPRHFLN